MRFLDYLGKLWNPDTVGQSQRQTDSSLASTLIKQTFVQHPMRGMTPAMLNTILDQAERGNLLPQHELFLDMEERDPHLHAEMSKRKRAVIGLPRKVLPPTNATDQENAIADKLNDIITNISGFDDLLLNLLDAIGHGFSCVEITWEYKNGIWQPQKLDHRPPYWFQLDIETRTQIRLRDMSANGADLWPFGWIIHTHAAKSGEIARAGLYRILAWPWLMKQYSLRDLAEYLEIYGLPVKIGKYPRSAPDDDKDNLYRALQQLGRNVAGIMPDDMSIDFLKESLGSADPFMRMVEYCDTAITLAILGQTLSTSARSTGLGSGVAGLQGDVRHDLIEADVAQLSATLTKQLIYPLLVLNGWDTGRPFVYSMDADRPENLTIFADAMQKLVATGLTIPVEWIRRTVGIPEPKDGEEIIGGKPILPITNNSIPTTTTTSAALSQPKHIDVIPSNYVDTQAKRLETDMNPLVDDVLTHVRKLLKESTNIIEFKHKLTHWLPEYKNKDITELLTKAFAASTLAGIYEIKQGQ